MDKHARKVVINMKIMFTVFMMICLSMTMFSHVSLQLKASETSSDSVCKEITIVKDGSIVSDSPDCQARALARIANKTYRLKENISFGASNGIVIKCSNIVLDLAGFVVTTTESYVPEPKAGIMCTDSVEEVEIINGTVEKFHFGVLIEQGSSRINVTNITLERSFVGIAIENSGSIKLTENEIKDSVNCALSVHHGSDVMVAMNNITSSSGTGLIVKYSTQVDVTGNTIISRKGADIDESGFVSFASNTLTGCTTQGVEVQKTDPKGEVGDCSITNNVISNSSNAIHLRGEMCEDVIVSGNEILNCEGYGIHIKEEARSSTVFNNTITNTNGIGIHLLNTSNNKVVHNILILNEGIAIKLEKTSSTNVSFNSALNNSVGIDCMRSHGNLLVGNTATSNHLTGISLSHCTNNTVLSNKVEQSQKGICLSQSSVNRILDNNVINNEQGIITNNSDSVTVSANHVVLNRNDAISIQDSINSTVSGNNVSLCASAGITCLNISDSRIYGNNVSLCASAGITCLNISDSRIYGNNVTFNRNGEGIAILQGLHCYIISNNVSNNTEGILLVNSTQSVLTRNNVSNNTEGGLCLSFGASDNTIYNNTVTLNAGLGGVWLDSTAINNNIIWNNVSRNKGGLFIESGQNEIYFNNFIDNLPFEAKCISLKNNWDDGYLGNYWSDYRGADDDKDGIGDDSYSINGVNDLCPLMGFLVIFEARTIREEQRSNITLISNSTVVLGSASFTLDPFPIRFNLTESPGATAFCKIIFPTKLMQHDFNVTIDNREKVTRAQALCYNETCYVLYFQCCFENKSTLSIKIDGDISGLYEREDIDRNGIISIIDLSIVAMAFGAERGDDRYAEYIRCDINDDGKIDVVDLAAVASKFRPA